MRSDKRSPITINTDLMASGPFGGSMKKLSYIYSVLNDLHKDLSSVGALLTFEALCGIEVTLQMFCH